MEQVHVLSNQYQTVHRGNKAKKRQLQQLTLSNNDLRKCYEHARDEISKGTESLLRAKQEARQLLARKDAAEREILKVRALETELEELNSTKDRLSREEAKYHNLVNTLATDFSNKREEWFVLKALLSRAEDGIDEVVNGGSMFSQTREFGDV
jgi:chromosome segregation ATPase